MGNSPFGLEHTDICISAQFHTYVRLCKALAVIPTGNPNAESVWINPSAAATWEFADAHTNRGSVVIVGLFQNKLPFLTIV